MTARSLPPSFSGKLAQMPWDAGSRKQRLERSRQRQIVDQNPANFVPEFDVIYELQCNRDEYSVLAEEKARNLSIHDYPTVCAIAFSAIQANLGKSNEPPVDTCISCCISNGVAELRNDDRINELISLRDKFNKISTLQNGDEVTLVYNWFTTFKMDVPMSGGRRNFRVPIAIHHSLSQLSKDLGVKIGALGTICAMLTLADQICINKDHCKEMQGFVDKFLRLVKFRVASTEAVMSALSEPTSIE